jgi:hypothetical protein
LGSLFEARRSNSRDQGSSSPSATYQLAGSEISMVGAQGLEPWTR